MFSSSKTDIYRALKKVGNSFSITDIIQILEQDRNQKGGINQFLATLVSFGMVRKGRKGRYTKRSLPPLMHGTVKIKRNGQAWFTVTSGAKLGNEFLVHRNCSCASMDGDEAYALEIPERNERRPHVLILEISKHAAVEIVGRCYVDAGTGHALVYAEPEHVPFTFKPAESGHSVNDMQGMVVRLRILTYPHNIHPGTAEFLEILGPEGDPAVDILTVAAKAGIPLHFAAEVERQAAVVDVEVSVEDLHGREDLRHIPFVTIDGADAKDFDDAVALESASDGSWILWVAIADVSHYVKPGTALDIAAYERGNSTYFPGMCLPMLPEPLSNGICSLKPGVERLAVVLRIYCPADATSAEMKPCLAVIRSRARLTYTQVQDSLEGVDVEDDVATISEELAAMLKRFQLFTRLLNKKRFKRGSLDFDIPEADIELDASGHTVGITRRQRLESHRIIEECMLLANECVAGFLQRWSIPGIFRLHDKPEMSAMHLFQEFLGSFNIGIALDSNGVEPGQLREILEQLEDPAQAFIVNRVLLRSMKQAYYSAQAGEHFALATNSYGHFTSPIRRYADLVQHRMLRLSMDCMSGTEADQGSVGSDSMEDIAAQVTRCERRSMEAEREIVALRSCQFMQHKINEVFSGFITGVTEFGFFVELDAYFVEGLVHIRTLGDDFYQYDPVHYQLVGRQRRRIFKIGQKLDVVVHAVRLNSREIDFILPESLKELKHKCRRGRSGLKK